MTNITTDCINIFNCMKVNNKNIKKPRFLTAYINEQKHTV